MGEIVASMELENTSDSGIVRRGLRDESTVRRATVDGVVATGVVMLVLPEDVVGDRKAGRLRRAARSGDNRTPWQRHAA